MQIYDVDFTERKRSALCDIISFTKRFLRKTGTFLVSGYLKQQSSAVITIENFICLLRICSENLWLFRFWVIAYIRTSLNCILVHETLFFFLAPTKSLNKVAHKKLSNSRVFLFNSVRGQSPEPCHRRTHWSLTIEKSMTFIQCWRTAPDEKKKTKPNHEKKKIKICKLSVVLKWRGGDNKTKLTQKHSSYFQFSLHLHCSVQIRKKKKNQRTHKEKEKRIYG